MWFIIFALFLIIIVHLIFRCSKRKLEIEGLNARIIKQIQKNNYIDSVYLNNIVYIDYNICIILYNNKDKVDEFTRIIKKNNMNVVYSPAHLEEIAHSDEGERDSYITFLNTITNYHEIRPLYEDKPLFLIREDAHDCYGRVVNDYGIVTTSIVENKDYNFIKSERLARQINSVRIGNLAPNKIFGDKEVVKVVSEIIGRINICREIRGVTENKSGCFRIDTRSLFSKDCKFDVMRCKGYYIIELLIEVLMKILNIIGYGADSEKSIKHSATHDISHAHYATMSNYFISEDRRFRKRVKAIYSFLEVPTKVYSFEEFINRFR